MKAALGRTQQRTSTREHDHIRTAGRLHPGFLCAARLAGVASREASRRGAARRHRRVAVSAGLDRSVLLTAIRWLLARAEDAGSAGESTGQRGAMVRSESDRRADEL